MKHTEHIAFNPPQKVFKELNMQAVLLQKFYRLGDKKYTISL